MVDFNMISSPALVLHKNFIHNIHIQDKIKRKITFEPTRQLQIILNNRLMNNFASLEKNLIRKYKNTVQTIISFTASENIDQTKIESFIDLILANMNVSSFRLLCYKHDLTKSKLIMKILEQKTLKQVWFNKCEFIDNQLYLINKYSHVKQWQASFFYKNINKHRLGLLKQLLAEKRDNSVFFEIIAPEQKSLERI